MITKNYRWLAGCICIAVTLVSGLVHSQTSNGDPPDNDIGGDDSPTGVSGGFNGMVNTACAYDPYTGNAKRVIDDIVVPGTVGAYPLKWSRIYNSRDPDIGNSLGITWRHSYMWSEDNYGGDIVRFPDGREVDFNEARGIPERLPQAGQLILGDGGQVIFDPITYNLPNGQYVKYRVARIIDPYGLTTTISYETTGQDENGNDIYRMSRITEPGGRYLLLSYSAADGTTITGVQAVTADNNVTQSVTYTYSDTTATGGVYTTLTAASYSDGTVAQYTYQNDNSGKNGAPKIPLLQTCDDVRYSGPMHQIQYLFVLGDRIRGKIKSEMKPGSGEAVSTLTFPATRAQTRVETRGDGPKRTFTYDTAGHLLSFTDFKNSASVVTTLYYDNNGFVGEVRDASSHYTIRTNEPVTGRVTHLLQADLTSAVDFDYGDPNNPYYLWTRTDENRHTTYFYRDGNHRVYQINYPGPDVPYETFTYNPSGQVLTHRRTNGYFEHFVYDGAGRLRKAWNPTATAAWPPPDSEPHIELDYYPGGHPWADRVASVRNQLYYYTYYEYDLNAAGQPCAGRGLITKVTHPDGSYVSSGYDNFGNPIWQENELRKRTTLTYDDYNRILSTAPPAPAGPTTFTYDRSGSGDPYLHTARAVHLQTDGDGVTIEKQYDENFRVGSIAQLDGSDAPPTTYFYYGPTGLLQQVHDPRNFNWMTSYTYTPRDQVQTVTDAQKHVTTSHYDPAGNVDYVDRPDTKRTTRSYDELNRVQTVVEPVTDSTTKTTTFTYWPSGKVRTEQDDNGQITTFEYDASDLRTRMVYPDQTSYQQWTYDGAKNLVTRRTVGGKTQNFEYDVRNRPVIMWWDGDNSWDWASYSFDVASRLTNANNENGSITRQYDDAGRLLTEEQNIYAFGTAKTVAYGSDAAGRRTAMGLAGTNYQFAYSYDTLGRLDQLLNVQNSPTGPTTSLWFQYSYDAASNQTQRFCAMNGVAQMYHRDELGRIDDLSVQKIAAPNYPGTPEVGTGGTPLITTPSILDGLVNPILAAVEEMTPAIGTVISSEQYIYDAMSRATDVQRGGTQASGNDHFDYDYSGQLSAASYTNWPGGGTRNVTYAQDNLGNRSQVNDSGSAQGYARNGSYLNQYVTAPAGPVGNDGDHQITGYSGLTYGYLDGKLTSLSGNGNFYSARYDALGRCITRSLNGRVTYYTYDGQHPICEWNPDGTTAGWNLYGQGIDEILLRGDYVIVPSGQGYFFQQNRLGSVTHLTGFAGELIEKYRYDAFGAPTTVEPVLGYFNNRFRFTGREYLEAFGIYEYRNRAYHPGLGRFLSEDPTGFDAGDANLFRYCGGDPVNAIDPMGLGASILYGYGGNIGNGNINGTTVITPRPGGLGNWGLGVALSYTPGTSAPSNPSWASFELFVGLSPIDSVQQLSGWSMATGGNLGAGPFGLAGSVGNINIESHQPFTLTLAGTVGTPTLTRAGITTGASKTVVLYDSTFGELGGLIGGLIADALDYATDKAIDALVDFNFDSVMLNLEPPPQANIDPGPPDNDPNRIVITGAPVIPSHGNPYNPPVFDVGLLGGDETSTRIPRRSH
jgi:RHS repeat-associated protein